VFLRIIAAAITERQYRHEQVYWHMDIMESMRSWLCEGVARLVLDTVKNDRLIHYML